MKATLLQIRLIQLIRLVSGLGIFYSAFFLGLLALILLIVARQYEEQTGALVVTGLICTVVFVIHQSRQDKPFVFKHLPSPHLQFFTEYLGFCLPFILPAFFAEFWYLALLVVPALALIVLLKTETRQKTRLPQLSRLLGPKHFEWISGVRKSFPFLILLLALALATSWLKIVPLLFLWLFTTVVAAFYQQCEPLNILAAPAKNARKLLHAKLKTHIFLLVICSVPILAVNAFFQPELAWVNLIFLALQVIFLAFSILLKYSAYAPNADLTGNSLLLSIAAIGIIIPFMLPLPLVMAFRNYGKAVRNLNRYLHD